jgi:hypothetical protein
MSAPQSSDGLRVDPLQGSESAEYDAFVARRPEANLYHTLVWRDVIREVFGHRDEYLVARKGGKIDGVMPLFLVRFPVLPALGSKLLSLPYDIGSGGPLAGDADSARALVVAAIERAKSQRVTYLEIRLDRPAPWLEELGFRVSQPVLTSEMELDGEEAVWGRVREDHRKAMKKAERRGVVVREGSEAADFERFYEVYCRTFLAFGTPPYPARYFQTLHRRLTEQGSARLLLAEVEARCVGGLIFFHAGTNLVSKFAASLPEGNALRVYPALYGRAIELALELGCRRLSWGTSAPNQTGLIEFKERWGARTSPVFAYSLPVAGEAPGLERYYDSDGLPQRVWRHLPLPVTKLLGGPLNRWFC